MILIKSSEVSRSFVSHLFVKSGNGVKGEYSFSPFYAHFFAKKYIG